MTEPKDGSEGSKAQSEANASASTPATSSSATTQPAVGGSNQLILAAIGGVVVIAVTFLVVRPPTKPVVPDPKTPASEFARCVASATEVTVKGKKVANDKVEVTVEKAMSAKKDELTQDEREVARQVLGPTEVASVIDACRSSAHLAGDIAFMTAIYVGRSGPGGSTQPIIHALVERKDGLGSCISGDTGMCRMQILGTDSNVVFNVKHEAYQLPQGEISFKSTELRQNTARLMLSSKPHPEPLKVQVIKAGSLVRDGKVRVEGAVVDNGSFWLAKCDFAHEDRRCRVADLSTQEAIFEHDANFESVRVYLTMNGVEALAREFRAGETIVNPIDIVLDVAKPGGPPTPVLPPPSDVPPCGGSDLLYSTVSGFRGWESAGKRTISAKIGADGRLSNLAIEPASPKLSEYLGARRLEVKNPCTATVASLSYEATP